MERFEYAVKLAAVAEGGFVVTCRDLPQLVTQGEDEADALKAADAMDEVFAAYMRGGLPFPAPTKAKRRERLVSPPAETVAKAALYVAMREAGIRQFIHEMYICRLQGTCGVRISSMERGPSSAG